MPDAPVIVNNTPLVALWVLGRLDLFRELFGEVLIPPTVRDEFLATERAQRQIAPANAPWIKTVALTSPRRALTYAGLDSGEAEVLALAEELDNEFIAMTGAAFFHRIQVTREETDHDMRFAWDAPRRHGQEPYVGGPIHHRPCQLAHRVQTRRQGDNRYSGRLEAGFAKTPRRCEYR
jgi:hypothetical protein